MAMRHYYFFGVNLALFLPQLAISFDLLFFRISPHRKTAIRLNLRFFPDRALCPDLKSSKVGRDREAWNSETGAVRDAPKTSIAEHLPSPLQLKLRRQPETV